MLYRSVKYKHHSLDAVFAALADPTRRAIAERLTEGPASVTELAEQFAAAVADPGPHLVEAVVPPLT